MNRRHFFLTGAAALSVAGRLAVGQEEGFEATLARFTAVDWGQYAFAIKRPGFEPPWQLRLAAEYHVARAGQAAAPSLLRLAEGASPHVRGFAAQMLGVTGVEEGKARLLPLARSDPSPLVRNYAVEALSRLPQAAEDDAVAEAIAAARQDPNGNVRFTAQQSQLRLQQRVPGGPALRQAWIQRFDPRNLGTAKVGEPAPDFILPSDSGEQVQLAAFAGKHAVLLLFQLADW